MALDLNGDVSSAAYPDLRVSSPKSPQISPKNEKNTVEAPEGSGQEVSGFALRNDMDCSSDESGGMHSSSRSFHVSFASKCPVLQQTKPASSQ